MYFGTIEKFQEVKWMLTELPANNVGYSTTQQLQNGGATAKASTAFHRVFDVSWKGNADEIGLIKDYAYGYYGTGLMYLVLNHAKRRNVFAPNWAAPRLIEGGDWPDIYDTPGTFAPTSPTPTYGNPTRSVTYTVVAATAYPIPTKRFLIPIPADSTLFLGWTGASTNGGMVAVRPILPNGTYGSVSNLVSIGPTSPTRMYNSFAGSSYAAVEVFVTATAIGTATVTVTSLMGQIMLTAGAPALPVNGNFITGKGFSGFKFTDGITETITQDTTTGREMMTINATLTEVGQWQR